jgi:hypothetical protein
MIAAGVVFRPVMPSLPRRALDAPLFATLLGALAFTTAAAGQRPAPGAADVEERAVVVARDAFVGGRIRNPGDVTVTLDGRNAPMVAFAESDTEPLHSLIVHDAALGDTTELRRAAVLVAGLAAELTALGPVRVVVLRSEGADERVAWTTDSERVERSLARLGIEGASDEILSGLRLPWTAAEALGEPAPTAEQARDAARAATLAIVRSSDRLLELAAEAQRSRARASRRLLLLAGGGFDPCPGAFFGVGEIAPALTGCAAGAASPDPGLELGPTLATLGWTVAAVLPPEPEDARAWRFGMLDRVDDPTTVVDHVGEGSPALVGVTIKINQERKPARARAFLEQARAHLDAPALEAPELEAAEHSVRKAIHHFADGRKTRAEEGDAWRLLAAIHARRGEAAETGRALLRAHRMTPRDDRTAAESASASARLATAYSAARRPLERITAATGGAAIYDAEALARALDGIAGRSRITYQFADAVAAEPLRLEARAGGALLEAAPWTSPTPTRLASMARARRLLRDADATSQRPAFGVFAPAASADAAGLLTLYLELSAASPEVRRWSTGPWRVTVLRSELDVEQHHVAPPERESGSDRFALEVELERPIAPIDPIGAIGAIGLILVEDLATGAWGFELESF